MSLTSILVHLDDSDRASVRVACATQLAKAHNALLVGLVPTGLCDGEMPADAVPNEATDFSAVSADYLRERAERIIHAFRRVAAAGGCPSYEVRETDEPAAEALLHHGKACDLMVVGQDATLAPTRPEGDHLVDRLVLGAGRPVLVVPSAGRFEGPPTHVVVAWDASREAALALQDALPILHQAKRVTIVSFVSADQHKGKVDEEDRVTLTRWLRQHGVQPIWDWRTTQIDVGDALLSHVADLAADLIVMGGYGHPRWRERLLGGVTRDVLAHMTVPVLFAH